MAAAPKHARKRRLRRQRVRIAAALAMRKMRGMRIFQ
jgi:hypothetical protein